jgi:hypothetical protein
MGSTPSPSPYIPPPKAEDPLVQEAMKKERELALRRSGRQSTILTSGQGLTDTGGGKTLLGA